ncbi:hypothetical protein I4U23_011960 [Adineta vaga]|nr:hypothetical protein I4U23_011960 [Adineta vaga]
MDNSRSQDPLSTITIVNDGLVQKSMDEHIEQDIESADIISANLSESKPNDFHILSLHDLFIQFQTNQNHGLSTDQVLQLRKQHGENKLAPPKKPNYIWIFFSQLLTGFNIFLWIAAIFAFLAWKPFGEPDPQIANLALGIVLCLIIFLNGTLDSYQVIKSIKIVASFANLLPTLTTVRRDGVEQQIVAENLVPGDIVLIRMGEKLPADLRIIACDSLKVNNANLTGESKAISCMVECTHTTMLESKNIVYCSSMIEQGTGEGVVIAIGDQTMIGRMSKLTQGNGGDEITGLHREFNRFLLFVCIGTVIAVAILWITWGVWLQRDHPTFVTYNNNIVNSVGMIVAFLPVGLPSCVTFVLTIVAKRMYRQKVLVKSLQIVETFNSVSVIATDKTGTLTQNQMTVTHLLWDLDGIFTISNIQSGEQPSPREEQTTNAIELIERRASNAANVSIEVIRDLFLGACLCNNAEVQLVADVELGGDAADIKREAKIVGDAADTALYKMCSDACQINMIETRSKNHRLHVLPFNSNMKLMISANTLEHDPSKVLILMKGAPDFVIQRCSTYKTKHGNIELLTSDIQQMIIQRQETFGKDGYRLIALCQQTLEENDFNEHFNLHRSDDLHGFPPNNYTFIGLFALIDPPRAEVPDAVLKARHAGIRVAMVTGDHPTTAKSIANQVNIFSPEISINNGLDIFKSKQDNNGKITIDLFRNDRLLEKHEVVQVTKLNLNIGENNHEDARILPWYKRMIASCKNQFRDPVSENKNESINRMNYIPYSIIVTGREIENMDDYMWDWVLSHQEIVFARTSPEQKLCIVTEFQRRGEIVAVTGDGTNDALPLKYAHLGVAMQSGTDVSKDAGDMILLDNNFSSIIRAIKTGRLVSDNLKKVAIHLLPGGSWSQIWPIFFNLWFGMPLALSAILAITFCMVNDVFLSLAMANEKPERDIMSRPPSIRSKDRMLNLRLLFHAFMLAGNAATFVGFFSYCYYWIDNGVPFYSFMFTFEHFGKDPPLTQSSAELRRMTSTAQSAYYCSTCVFQMINFFCTRTRYASIIQHNPFWGKSRNWYVFLAIVASTGVQLLVTRVVWFNNTFDTQPIPVKYILPTIGFSILWLLIDELRKLCVRKWPKGFLAKIAW